MTFLLLGGPAFLCDFVIHRHDFMSYKITYIKPEQLGFMDLRLKRLFG